MSVAARSVHDVLIVGGGVVGASLAALLRSSPLTRALRVAVVDEGPLAADWALPDIPEARCSTLTPASVRTLQAAGAWAGVEASGRAATFEAMQVWDGGAGGCVRYQASEAGLPLLGHVVENRVLCSSLAERLREEGGAELLARDSLAELHLPRPGAADLPQAAPGEPQAGPDWAAARLRSGSWLRARLVVAADGGRSRCRTLAGVRSVGWRYSQQAVVGTVVTEAHHTAWQRFTASGPLALLPMAGGYSSVVWSTDEAHAARLMAASPQEFAEEVDAALQGGALGDGPASALLASLRGGRPAFPRPPRCSAPAGPSPRGRIPLAFSHAGVYSAPRLALCGDAAHSVHPLAGQGLNLGMSDVQLLCDALAGAVRDGRDCGEEALLSAYGRSATAANLPFLAAFDGAAPASAGDCAAPPDASPARAVLQRLFASQQPQVAMARSLGMDLVHSLPPVRRAIIKMATGGEGH